MKKDILYLYRDKHAEFVEPLRSDEEAGNVDFLAFDSANELKEIDFLKYSQLIVSGDLSDIKKVLEYAIEYDLPVGIVPLESQSSLAKMYDFPRDKKKAFAQAMLPCKSSIDALYCNGVMVLWDAKIGDSAALDEFEYEYANRGLFKRIGLFVHAFFDRDNLRHYKYSVQTQNDDIKELSAIGMVGFEHENGSWLSSVFSRYLGAEDGYFVLAILAPTSLFEYFVTQPLKLLIGKNSKKIPSSLGYIRSDSIVIECKEPQSVLIDDIESLQTPVKLSAVAKVLKLNVGQKYWDRARAVKSGRSSIKLENIPRDEESIEYLGKGLPVFEHASKEMYASLFTSLREDSNLSVVFMVMLVLSALIATLGLFINSASVIIGAMLIAPLMQPIVSLGMGALRRDVSLQVNSVKTILVGVFAVILTSMFVALIVPIETLTSEMAGRLSPSILDLFIAIASGVAAAYAKNNEKILGSLAGVSIAVALVPPIAVAGVGLGWANLHMFGAAFLLFVTNLVGIVFAVAVTFMVLGYSPIKVAKRGIGIWLGVMALIAIPLYSSFVKIKDNARIQDILGNLSFDVGENRVKLAHIEIIQAAQIPNIRCEIIVSKPLTPKDKAYVKELILKSIGTKAEVIATFRYRL